MPDGFFSPTDSPKFTELYFAGSDLSKSTLSDLSGISSIETLAITRSGQNRVGDVDCKALTMLQKLKHLRTLKLRGLNLTNVDFSKFGSVVEHLDYRKSSLSAHALRSASVFENLRVLDLSETEIGDDCIGGILGFTKLRSLNVTGTQLTNRFIKALDELVSLRLVEIDPSVMSGVSSPSWQTEFINDQNTRLTRREGKAQTRGKGVGSKKSAD